MPIIARAFPHQRREVHSVCTVVQRPFAPTAAARNGGYRDPSPPQNSPRAAEFLSIQQIADMRKSTHSHSEIFCTFELLLVTNKKALND